MNRLILALTPLTLLAQAQDTSLKGVIRLNKAPVSSEVLRVRFPRAVESKLANGLTVLVLESHRTPNVVIDLAIPASSLSDPADVPGVADATADLLRLGTKKHDSKSLAEALAENGVTITSNVGFGSRSTHVSLRTLSDNLDTALEFLTEVLLTPSFPTDELDKWKQRQLAQLQNARTNPGFIANERMYRLLYDDARAVTAPTPESVRKLTRDHLVAFYNTHYKPSAALLGVAGDVSGKTIAAKLEKTFSSWSAGSSQQPKVSFRDPIQQGKIVLIDRPNSVQSQINIANLAINRQNPDYVACQVMNRVLGGGPAARLFRNIREDKGYTYGIGSNFTALAYLHHFSMSTSVRTEVTGPALMEILKEFHDIHDREVPAEELENAKRAMVASFALSLESTGAVLSQLMLLKEYGFPADYWDRYGERVMAVTAADVQRLARKYVPIANAQAVFVGYAAKIRETLKKIGPIEEYTQDGARIN